MATDTGLGPGTFQVTAYRCRCGHEWVPKALHQPEAPRVCPQVQERQLGPAIPVPAEKPNGDKRYGGFEYAHP